MEASDYTLYSPYPVSYPVLTGRFSSFIMMSQRWIQGKGRGCLSSGVTPVFWERTPKWHTWLFSNLNVSFGNAWNGSQVEQIPGFPELQTCFENSCTLKEKTGINIILGQIFKILRHQNPGSAAQHRKASMECSNTSLMRKHSRYWISFRTEDGQWLVYAVKKSTQFIWKERGNSQAAVYLQCAFNCVHLCIAWIYTKTSEAYAGNVWSFG